ncbi:BolA/IbaG family iron-sulfur metabolism protein [Colwellia demingiae]|uniref:BolA/IbaG family iron-sulfur metabolism protein n=1 Tax=Colwellia demingiae TaxID=89401 RepID=A0A5C6QN54_9GAMM|nr:BolA/IbaG family iron-sulfur metabolism protein [Colwellia demingiae]TWX70646.1 BolA/IbaG family iron-sulfur metabolism protein [Colwellia demingiae]
MEVGEIEQLVSKLINEALELDEVHVKFDGSQCRINAVSDMFDDLSRVKRQQAVLKPLADIIKDGTIHAVTVKTFNKAQWQRDKLFNS